MSPAFTLAIAENIPDAVHVFDRFHAVKLMNKKLTEIRRQSHKMATAQDKKVLKVCRFILLKNPENLDTQKDAQKQLEEVLRINRSWGVGYYLKEKLRLLWEQELKAQAESLLDEWIKEARASGVQQLKVMAKTLNTRRKGLLARYDHRISTAALEGTNHKIGAIQRRA
jgi:transposase